jgi:AcrR family transcriptional regulator
MTTADSTVSTPSARRRELLELAYAYVLEHGLAEVSLRPLAKEIGSSPRVLLYLFGSKDELVRTLLARARRDELDMLDRLRSESGIEAGLDQVGRRLWSWLSEPEHRALLNLWVEGYGRSLVERDGAWAEFARASVTVWLDVLAESQPQPERDSAAGLARRTSVLALLRGAMLDLLATGDRARTTEAVHRLLPDRDDGD